MTCKTLLTTLSLILSPGLALAMCDTHRTLDEASQCGQGMVWDGQTQSCIAQTTS